MNAIQGARALRYGGPLRECPRNISPVSILVSTSLATTLLKAYQLVRAPPTMKLRRRLVSKTSYAYDL